MGKLSQQNGKVDKTKPHTNMNPDIIQHFQECLTFKSYRIIVIGIWRSIKSLAPADKFVIQN